MAIISQGLELMKPDYFHYLPPRWRQSERADTQVGVTAPGLGEQRSPLVEGGGEACPEIPTYMEWSSHRHRLESTGDKTIVPKRGAGGNPRQGRARRTRGASGRVENTE